jgi:hypothetical protein
MFECYALYARGFSGHRDPRQPDDSLIEIAEHGSAGHRRIGGNTKVQWTSLIECRMIFV